MTSKFQKKSIFYFLNSKFWVFAFLFSIFYFLFSAPFALGAKLYLEPNSGEYRPGDTFVTDIRIDNEGKCINAVEVNLAFPPDVLKVVDVSQGDSILTLWVETPTFNQNSGLISFAGGIPGEYCGRIAGDPGPSNILVKIIFKVPGTMVSEKKENIAEIKFLDTSQVILSDKLGTKAELITENATFKILSEPGVSKEEWQEIVKNDTVPPEPFEIILDQEKTILEGKYFIIFSTLDKQTGIDFFEVKEGEREWKKATSPYPLEDQSLQSIIEVKAVDKAGNERIAEFRPLVKIKPAFPRWIIFVIIISVFIVILFIVILKLKQRKNQSPNL